MLLRIDASTPHEGTIGQRVLDWKWRPPLLGYHGQANRNGSLPR